MTTFRSNNPEHQHFDHWIGPELEDSEADDAGQDEQTQWDLGQTAFRSMIGRAQEASKQPLDRWKELEKTGLEPLNEEQRDRYLTYIKQEATRGSFDFTRRVAGKARKSVATVDDITETLKEVYKHRGIGKEKADKVLEHHRDDKIVEGEKKKAIATIDEKLEETEGLVTPINKLINEVIPGFIKPSGPTGQQRASVMPKLSKKQGEKLASELDEDALGPVLEGFYQTLAIASHPPIPSERQAVLTLGDAKERQDYDLLWAAVMGARSYYNQTNSVLAAIKKDINELSTRQATEESKYRQVREWEEERGKSLSDPRGTLWDVEALMAKSKEMSDEEAEQRRKAAEQDAKNSEQAKRTDDLG